MNIYLNSLNEIPVGPLIIESESPEDKAKLENLIYDLELGQKRFKTEYSENVIRVLVEIDQ